LSDKLLMIAYHFPPSAEISGALRTLGMARYLGESGWQVVVLTPRPPAYPRRDSSTLGMVPPGCEVVRTFALDIRRHIGIRGHYPSWLAQPDRWSSWWVSAVRHGMRIVMRDKPRVIWSTYPIATSHMIAASLHKRSGIPWIADFRDPVVAPFGQEKYLTAKTLAWVERETILQASACVFVTQGARELYEARYANIKHGPFVVIPNGFDEEAFYGFAWARDPVPKATNEPVVLVHSGMLYPRGRNPEAFFRAISSLLSDGRLAPGALQVILRASGSEPMFAKMVVRYGLEGIVELAPGTDRGSALAEQSAADGLLLFQGSEFNAQVPAKIYEYFRVGNPVLGLVDETGDTATLIRREGAGLTANIMDSDAIANRLLEFIDAIRQGSIKPISRDAVMHYSRRGSAGQLVELMDKIAPV
jgi:glycosyltransferase involved in cell wall biosynthesis